MKITFKFFAVLVLFLLSSNTFSQSNNPKIIKAGSKITDFIPVGWKKIYQASGDLNKDSMTDEVLIIENTSPKNFIKNVGMGGDTLNVNPRILVVLFRESDINFKLIAQNSKFIPSQNDEESPCLLDPLSETNGIEITNGILKISYQYFMSCGSWYVTNAAYTFRFQNQKFELIGYDSSDFHRASGEKSESSINFSTKKRSSTQGGNLFEDEKDKPKTNWKKIKLDKLFALEEMDENSFERIENID